VHVCGDVDICAKKVHSTRESNIFFITDSFFLKPT
jgi:hypothetical protein